MADQTTKKEARSTLLADAFDFVTSAPVVVQCSTQSLLAPNNKPSIFYEVSLLLDPLKNVVIIKSSLPERCEVIKMWLVTDARKRPTGSDAENLVKLTKEQEPLYLCLASTPKRSDIVRVTLHHFLFSDPAHKELWELCVDNLCATVNHDHKMRHLDFPERTKRLYSRTFGFIYTRDSIPLRLLASILRSHVSLDGAMRYFEEDHPSLFSAETISYQQFTYPLFSGLLFADVHSSPHFAYAWKLYHQWTIGDKGSLTPPPRRAVTPPSESSGSSPTPPNFSPIKLQDGGDGLVRGEILMTDEHLLKFLNQNKSKVDDNLLTILDARAIISEYEADEGLARQRKISLKAFAWFCTSELFDLFNALHRTVYQDMSLPFSSYFIASSHNTYLPEGQTYAHASVEMYRQVLLSGCRCVELDCWTEKDEPVIKHGWNMCSSIPFYDVIVAIRDYSFITSPYPVILSFEDHCGPKQQAKMAVICREVLGNYLLSDYLDPTHQQDRVFPSPEDLKYKVLIKHKKTASRRYRQEMEELVAKHEDEASESEPEDEPNEEGPNSSHNDPQQSIVAVNITIDIASVEPVPTTTMENTPADPNLPHTMPGSSTSSSTLDEGKNSTLKKRGKLSEKGVTDEVLCERQLLVLVNYAEAKKFHSVHEEKPLYVYSLDESKARNALLNHPRDFVHFNRHCASRIYPKMRIQSSNFDPQPFWNAGCQFVALNYQTNTFPMQLNTAKFCANGECGYVLRPPVLRSWKVLSSNEQNLRLNEIQRHEIDFDPNTDQTIPDTEAYTYTFKILSLQNFGEVRNNVAVQVEVFGLPHDIQKKVSAPVRLQRGCAVPVDLEIALDPVYLSSISILRLSVVNISHHNAIVGKVMFPLSSLQKGFRHTFLQDCEFEFASMFMEVLITDYTPSALDVSFLVDPIRHSKYVSMAFDDIDDTMNQIPRNGDGSLSDLAPPLEADSSKQQKEADRILPQRDPSLTHAPLHLQPVELRTTGSEALPKVPENTSKAQKDARLAPRDFIFKPLSPVPSPRGSPVSYDHAEIHPHPHGTPPTLRRALPHGHQEMSPKRAQPLLYSNQPSSSYSTQPFLPRIAPHIGYDQHFGQSLRIWDQPPPSRFSPLPFFSHQPDEQGMYLGSHYPSTIYRATLFQHPVAPSTRPCLFHIGNTTITIKEEATNISLLIFNKSAICGVHANRSGYFDLDVAGLHYIETIHLHSHDVADILRNLNY